MGNNYGRTKVSLRLPSPGDICHPVLRVNVNTRAPWTYLSVIIKNMFNTRPYIVTIVFVLSVAISFFFGKEYGQGSKVVNRNVHDYEFITGYQYTVNGMLYELKNSEVDTFYDPPHLNLEFVQQ